MEKKRMRSAASSPFPLLLDQRCVDSLYELLPLALECFASLGVQVSLISGSALGCVRSRGILFCDDDIDLAILDERHGEVYERVKKEIPALLRARNCCYVERPWPAADRIRLNSNPSVWVDVFVLRRYASIDELRELVCKKENGSAQSEQYIAAALAPVVALSFPLWHYDHRLAVEMYPREFFREVELLPLRFDLSFGPIPSVPMPARPVPYLRRSYGADVFDV